MLPSTGGPRAVRAAVEARKQPEQQPVRQIADDDDARLAAGVLHMHDSVAATQFMNELREWRPGTGRGRSHQRDDGLDAVAGCLLSEPVRIGSLMGRHADPRPVRRDWRGVAPVVAPSDFSV